MRCSGYTSIQPAQEGSWPLYSSHHVGTCWGQGCGEGVWGVQSVVCEVWMVLVMCVKLVV